MVGLMTAQIPGAGVVAASAAPDRYPDEVAVSVVICTRNRCDLLRDTLDRLRALVVPPRCSWELVVVDNDGSAATAAVIDEYRGVLPLRHVAVAEPGLSKARNAALRVVRGDLVVFTDDDVRVDPLWVQAYVDAAHRWPDAGYFGGAIRARLGDGVPGWVRRGRAALAGMLCERDLGPAERRLRSAEFPFGPNMAVRRSALAQSTFDERVGRKGDQQMRGGEDSLFWQLRARGVWGVWVPSAHVEHHVPRSRADLGYLWSYYRGCGRAQVRLAVECRACPLGRVLIAPLRELAKSCLWWWVWARHLATLAWLSGQLSELGRVALRRAESAVGSPRHGRECS